MRLEYDATVDVAYLSLRELRTGERLGPTLLVENDAEFPGADAPFGALRTSRGSAIVTDGRVSSDGMAGAATHR